MKYFYVVKKFSISFFILHIFMKFFIPLFFLVGTCTLSAQKMITAGNKNWTDVTKLDKTIVTDIRYATTNNFTQTKIYDCGKCYLRPEVAKAIAEAQKIVKQKGYGGFKMFDCYRPKLYQQRLWAKKPDKDYVTPPKKGSMHSRGSAVDLTLLDKNGNEIDMGTPYDTFSDKAHYDYQDLPKEILSQRQFLRRTLEQVGFSGIRTEWWHFSYNVKQYKLSEVLWQCDDVK